MEIHGLFFKTNTVLKQRLQKTRLWED